MYGLIKKIYIYLLILVTLKFKLKSAHKAYFRFFSNLARVLAKIHLGKHKLFTKYCTDFYFIELNFLVLHECFSYMLRKLLETFSKLLSSFLVFFL